MNCKEVLSVSSNQIKKLKNKTLDIVDVKKPSTIEYAVQLSKVVSKLSPLIGNMIEFSTVDLLNTHKWKFNGKWERQDPGFPDALFRSDNITCKTGIEIKAWFPLATEITARFKDSVLIFQNDSINVALIAWLPEYVIYGKPKIIDVLIVSGKSIAEARDKHYHQPPTYLVVEPEDTSERTGNLQQTNTNGYKFQEDKSDIASAKEYIKSFGEEFLTYSPTKEYQEKLKELQGKYVYRADTNYAKIDRIEHPEIEAFKNRVENEILFQGKTIKEWRKLLSDRTPKEKLERELGKLIV